MPDTVDGIDAGPPLDLEAFEHVFFCPFTSVATAIDEGWTPTSCGRSGYFIRAIPIIWK